MPRHALLRILGLCVAVSLPPGLQAADDPSAHANGVEDLYIAEALYQAEQKEYLPAITRLQAALRHGRIVRRRNDARWLLVRLYLGYGMHYSAYDLQRRLREEQVEGDVPPKFWLDMAQQQFRRGYLGLTGLVQNSLGQMPDNTERRLQAERQMLNGQLMIRQGRYKDAAETLRRTRGSDLQEAYATFNRGVALMQDDQVDAGRAMLDRVGNLAGTDPESLALRDLANYHLGYNFLENNKGGSARAVLTRVRADGPYANRALLAMGWAQFKPVGVQQANLNTDQDRPKDCDKLPDSASIGVLMRVDPACIKEGPRSFKRTEVGNKEDKLRSAVLPWLLLAQRDAAEAPVLESLVATPYALNKLKSPHLAAIYYNEALKRYRFEQVRVERSITAVKADQLLDAVMPPLTTRPAIWNGQLRASQPGVAPDTRLLDDLLIRHDFHEAMATYRDLQVLVERIDAWQRRLDEYQRQLKIGQQAFNRSLARANAAASGQTADSAAAAFIDARPTLQMDRPITTLPGQFGTEQVTLPSNLVEPVASEGPKQLSFIIEGTSPADKWLTRIAAQRAKLAELEVRINSAMNAHREYLNQLALRELTVRQNNLNAYFGIASLNAAQLYEDLARAALQREQAAEDAADAAERAAVPASGDTPE